MTWNVLWNPRQEVSQTGLAFDCDMVVFYRLAASKVDRHPCSIDTAQTPATTVEPPAYPRIPSSKPILPSLLVKPNHLVSPSQYISCAPTQHTRLRYSLFLLFHAPLKFNRWLGAASNLKQLATPRLHVTYTPVLQPEVEFAARTRPISLFSFNTIFT